MFQLNEDCSYLAGWAVPNLLDEHAEKMSAANEYSKEEGARSDFRGIDTWIEHKGERSRIGVVRGYQSGDHIETVLEMPPDSSIASIWGKNGLFFGHFKDLSLQHRWSSYKGSNEVTKEALEVSICKEGARDGSHITQFYPSRRLLNCQSAMSLAAYAERYGYPAPPELPGVSHDDLRWHDVRNTPALAEYVEHILGPAVQSRRTSLLKLSGYIAASRAHKATTETPMASAMTNALAGAGNTPAPSLPQTPAFNMTPATALAAAATPAATPQQQPTPQQPAATPAAQPAQQPKPGTTTTTTVGASDAMVEDTEESRIAVLERVGKELAELTAENARLQQSLVAASNNAKKAELEREEAEIKTKIDYMIDNTDAWPEATQASVRSLAEGKILMARERTPAERAILYREAESAVRAMSKSAQTTADTQKQSASQYRSQYERDLTHQLSRNAIMAKNARQFAGSQPPVSAYGGAAAFTDDDSTAQQPNKRQATAVDESGTVAASARTTAPAPDTSIVPGTENWAGNAWKKSFEVQVGQREVLIPSYHEMKSGGFKAVETGTRRAARDANGNKVMIPEVSLEPALDRETPFGLKEWNASFYKDIMTSLRTDTICWGGRMQRPLPFDKTTYDARVADAQLAEQVIAQPRRGRVVGY